MIHTLFWNSLHFTLKISSKILYILSFSQQQHWKWCGVALFIGGCYCQCNLDWLFTYLSNTNKYNTNLSFFRLKQNGGVYVWRSESCTRTNDRRVKFVLTIARMHLLERCTRFTIRYLYKLHFSSRRNTEWLPRTPILQQIKIKYFDLESQKSVSLALVITI
jgi:hypothetical protein